MTTVYKISAQISAENYRALKVYELEHIGNVTQST